MLRRDFVKGMVAVPVAAQTALVQQAQPPLPVPSTVLPGAVIPPAAVQAAPGGRGMSDFNALPVTAVVPDAIATPEVRFFTESQLAALHRLCDLMMPPLNGYPGALQAEAPEFLDFLAGASPADRQQLYRQGLDHLNAEAQKQFGKPFAELSAEQADKIVRPALIPWISERPPTEPFPHFIAIAHQDIRTATMNSEMWNAAAVGSGERAPGLGQYWWPIDPDLKNWV